MASGGRGARATEAAAVAALALLQRWGPTRVAPGAARPGERPPPHPCSDAALPPGGRGRGRPDAPLSLLRWVAALLPPDGNNNATDRTRAPRPSPATSTSKVRSHRDRDDGVSYEDGLDPP